MVNRVREAQQGVVAQNERSVVRAEQDRQARMICSGSTTRPLGGGGTVPGRARSFFLGPIPGAKPARTTALQRVLPARRMSAPPLARISHHRGARAESVVLPEQRARLQRRREGPAATAATAPDRDPRHRGPATAGRADSSGVAGSRACRGGPQQREYRRIVVHLGQHCAQAHGNIFDHAGVRNRSAAVARMLPTTRDCRADSSAPGSSSQTQLRNADSTLRSC